MRHGRKRTDISQKLNNILFFLSGMLAVVVIGIIVIGAQTKARPTNMGYQELDAYNAEYMQDDYQQESEEDWAGEDVTAQEEDSEQVEKWQEGIIEYKGHQYLYNSNLKILLLMGVDIDGPVEEAKVMNDAGQSDAMFLLIANEETKELSVFSINRNTMTDIEMYDKNGTYLFNTEAQICLQHGYGDAGKLSCSRSVEAVSKLFNNLPIYGYVAINVGAVPQINHAVGGVEVQVLQDLDYPQRGVKLKKGKTVRLNDDEAYCYLRGRDVNEYDSATQRLRREEQYIINYFAQLQADAGSDSGKAEGVYQAIQDYLVTNLNFVDVAETLMGYDFSEERMYTVPGRTTMGEVYEEYHVDEDTFNDMLIQVFYKEV